MRARGNTVSRVIWIYLLIFYVSVNLYAQKSAGGEPYSFHYSELKSKLQIPVFKSKELDIDAAKARDLKEGIDNRFSVFEDFIIDIKQEGLKSDLPQENGSIWRYKVESINALALQLYFSGFLLPEGAKLFVYNENKSNIAGAFTAQNRQGKLMLASIPGSSLIIEYYEPYDVEFEGFIELGAVGQAYRDPAVLKSSEDSEGFIDVNMPEGESWQNEKHAVSKISFRVGGSGYVCTGALLNNARMDATPYFLTADHCINTSEVANTLVAYFNYEIIGGSFSLSPGLSLSGAQLLAHDADSDYCLLLLDEEPTSDYQAYFAPWNATESATGSSVSIHHPGGQVKKISLASSDPVSYDEQITWVGNNVSPPNSHWAVDFIAGRTAGGSSGSPLFTENKRQVIGQLHGGSTTDYYGKFSRSYQHSSNIAQYLDPDNTGINEMTEGFYLPETKPDPQIFPEFRNVCKNAAVKLTAMSAFDPESWTWSFSPGSVIFEEGSDASMREPTVIFTEDGIYDISLKVTNAAGEVTRIFNSAIEVGNGLQLDIDPIRPVDSCLCTTDSILLLASGAAEYKWSIHEDVNDIFYIVNDTVNPVTIKISDKPQESVDLKVVVNGSHGACSSELDYGMLLVKQFNDSIKNALQLYEGTSQTFSNKCADIEENEPIPPITSCTGTMSWCDEFGTGEDIILNSVWFYFIPEESGEYQISSTGMDNQIAVYQADDAEDLLNGNYVLVGANDDVTSANPDPVLRNLELNEGVKYMIQVDGSAGGVTGNFNIFITNTSGVSSEAITLEDNIVIYPQPVNDLLFIEFGEKESAGQIKIEVFNLSGSLVYSSIVENKYAGIIRLNTVEWTQGAYMLRLSLNTEVFVKKFIKL